MGLELKSAIAKRHREGQLGTSPDALLWVFTHMRQMPKANPTEDSPKNQARLISKHLWRQAQLQFGEMAEPVLANWGLETGKGLSICIQDLVEMDAIRLESDESCSDFEEVGIGPHSILPNLG
jgi:uncharacterized repeat protein (TIGR04138 family)